MTKIGVLSRVPAEIWFAILLGVGSFLLFVWHIGSPAAPYFDETHYVPAARALLERAGPQNIEHPLFAKTLIAGGMLLFGDGPVGWRLPSALCAVLAVLALYWIALMLFRDLRAAVCAALLLVFDQTHFIQARIAMLEMPMTACVLLGAGCLMQAHRSAANARRWEYAAAVLLGLAIGAKWLAIPYALFLLAGWGWVKWRDGGRQQANLLDEILPNGAKLLIVSLIVYFATFWPAFFYVHEPMTLSHLIGFQFEMLQSQRGAMAPHPYQSSWWQWPLMLRPIWYLFAKTGANYQAVLLVGNPLIYWGGLLAVLYCFSGWLKTRPAALSLTVAAWFFSVAIWIVIPKNIGFFYYYNFSAILLCLVIASLCQALGERGRRWLGWFTAAACAMFVYFYPIISAQPLPADDTWTSWVWMKSWY